jgi:hypothetical protein
LRGWLVDIWLADRLLRVVGRLLPALSGRRHQGTGYATDPETDQNQGKDPSAIDIEGTVFTDEIEGCDCAKYQAGDE